ncbi:MAG: UDP-N-acetylglucosamine 2-epimerase, partial [Acidimicrobiia bacterium]
MREGAAAIIFGTRPEAVKLAPLLWEMRRQAHVIHTGQHSLESLSAIMRDVRIVRPDVAGTWPAGHTDRPIGHAVAAVTTALVDASPDVVVVQGDTSSTLAGALAANRLGIPIVHVEAGLRAFDGRLPEERNRVVVDHLSDLL